MQTNRAYQYARCSAVLAADPEVPGHEATYDQALSNGLAAIVAQQWPGQELSSEGHVKSARQLLKVITKQADAQPDGTYLIAWPDRHENPEKICVNTEVLCDGINETQAARHGRGSGNLQRHHIDALLALDGHPALGRMTEVHSDGQWIKAEVEDRYEQERAETYLAFIGDDEAAARAERAPGLTEPYHPKHNPDREGTELEECRVCGYTSFRLGFPADFPDTGIGACLVCSYARSSDVSYYLTLNAEIAYTLPTD
ncbi:hypothetical protein ABT001_31730 [Streptomyces sp. NPDC002793]|uniref:hypothetical protein n=1 Tax=Streptomyces sp. NPDC002793 TaxID=3154432 RepID=UPI00333424AC